MEIYQFIAFGVVGVAFTVVGLLLRVRKLEKDVIQLKLMTINLAIKVFPKETAGLNLGPLKPEHGSDGEG